MTDTSSAPTDSSTQNAGQPASSSADSSPPSPEPAEPAVRMVKVKLDGQELDLPEDRVVADYQLREVSNKRFQEAAKLRAEADRLVGALKKGDFAQLVSAGVITPEEARQASEKHLTEYIQWEQLPDAEKARLVAEQERDQARAQLEQMNARERQAEIARINDIAAREVDQEVTAAVNELRETIGYGIEATPELVHEICRMRIAALEVEMEGGEPAMPTKKAAEVAYQRQLRLVKELLNKAPPNVLRQLLSKDVLDALREHDVQDALSQMPNRIRDGRPTDASARKRPEPVSNDGLFARLDRKYGLV